MRTANLPMEPSSGSLRQARLRLRRLLLLLLRRH
jgi:hypothetical protein